MQFTVGFHLPTGSYWYKSQLLALDAHWPSKAREPLAQLSQTSSTLADSLPAWEGCLTMHPDCGFADYVLRGIREGFRVGFDRKQPLSPARRNMPSALEVVEAYLGEEEGAGRILGPFQPGEIPDLHVNRLGVMPKGRASGKWRLITDLSFSEGASVNEGISLDLCSLSYTLVEKVAAVSLELGAYWQRPTLRRHTALYQSTRTTGRCLAWSGGGPYMWMRCFPSACVRPPKFLQRSRTPWNGVSAREV